MSLLVLIGKRALDLRKAFDSVWHNGLVHKLLKAGYSIYIVKLIRSYLVSRQAYVSLSSSKSRFFDVLSGVPQGSLIAPHLFNLFINDIPLPINSKLSLYADDTSLTAEVPWKNLKSGKKILIDSLRKVQSFFNNWCSTYGFRKNTDLFFISGFFIYNNFRQ